jgi:signal transduction histidine kinase
MKGVVSVEPEAIAVNRLPPPVVIEETLVDGHLKVPVERERFGSRTRVPVLEVPPGKRQIDVRYTALSFVSPDRVRFRWKLEGVDNDWREVGGRRDAQYNFLRPGDYTFRVVACNNDGVWNQEGAALALHVQPFFYETWWFLVLTGAAAAITVAATVRHFAVRRMKRELEALEQQRAVERDRARIAKDIHDDLGAGLTHITLLTELARRSPTEETPSHLNHISDMARELTRAMDETVWAVNPRNDSLEGLMTYVTKYSQDYLNVAGIRCRLDLPAQLPHVALTAETRHNLYLAVKETLNNVVKHAHATEAWLRLIPRADGFDIIVEDNGCGLNGDHGKVNSNRISSGQGLGNLEKRLAACAGRFVLSSAPGKGTRVELSVNVETKT